jgi:hypothetical protein
MKDSGEKVEEIFIEALNKAKRIVDKSEVQYSQEILITVFSNLMVFYRQAIHDKTMSGALNSTVASTLKKFGLGG